MEDSFINQPMLTCIGNKRKLVGNIQQVVSDLNKSNSKIKIFDGFAGSNVVARSLIHHCKDIYVNDMEPYSYIMAKCIFEKPTKEQISKIKTHIEKMNKLAETGPYVKGIITKNYCPESTEDIKEGERCFYTNENGLIIDTLRDYIDKVDSYIQHYLLGPLLIKASIHTNTAGVFKGFYKDKQTGIGSFGGTSSDALSRITQPIRLDLPIWSNNKYTPHIFNEDINNVIKKLPDDIDIIYLDPPYNQHPYSSNYFMLNLIIENKMPLKISKVSGIPSDWTRSDYNYKEKAIKSMKELLHESMKRSQYVLLSYNNEGIIKDNDWIDIFKPYKVEKKQIKYDTYKGSRNLKNRSNKVIEIIYIIQKQASVNNN